MSITSLKEMDTRQFKKPKLDRCDAIFRNMERPKLRRCNAISVPFEDTQVLQIPKPELQRCDAISIPFEEAKIWGEFLELLSHESFEIHNDTIDDEETRVWNEILKSIATEPIITSESVLTTMSIVDFDLEQITLMDEEFEISQSSDVSSEI
jgi:hypothetical protein